jgi:hypothetical protein
MLRETLEVTLKFLEQEEAAVLDKMGLQRHNMLVVKGEPFLEMLSLVELVLRELWEVEQGVLAQLLLVLTFMVGVVVVVVEVQSQQMVVTEVLEQTMVVEVVVVVVALSVLLRVQEEQEPMGLLWLQHISNYEWIRFTR